MIQQWDGPLLTFHRCQHMVLPLHASAAATCNSTQQSAECHLGRKLLPNSTSSALLVYPPQPLSTAATMQPKTTGMGPVSRFSAICRQRLTRTRAMHRSFSHQVQTHAYWITCKHVTYHCTYHWYYCWCNAAQLLPQSLYESSTSDLCRWLLWLPYAFFSPFIGAPNCGRNLQPA
jgi:hypothetical protein